MVIEYEQYKIIDNIYYNRFDVLQVNGRDLSEGGTGMLFTEIVNITSIDCYNSGRPKEVFEIRIIEEFPINVSLNHIS